MIKKWTSWLPIILVIIVFVLIISSFSKVRITVDDKLIECWTSGNTVEDVLNDLNLEINQHDNVSPALSTTLKSINNIKIKKGHQIILHIDGQEKKIITSARDVKEVLKLNNIVLSSLDKVEPAFETKIVNGLAIRITRVEEKILEVNEEIPYETEFRNDKDLWRGQTRTISKGKKGLISKTYLVTYHDNQEITRKITGEKIIKKPTKEVVLRGTKSIVQRAGKNLEFSKTMVLNSTAYTHTGNKTFTDVWPQRGTVAVDPRVIPLGTRLYVDGYGFAVAQDIGSAIRGERIDLFMETKSEALRWGQRLVRVFILK